MTFWRPLTHVALPDDDRAALTLAIRENGNVSHAQFVRDVLRWRAGFRQVPGDAVALYFDDAVEFSAALFGAWHADKHVIRGGQVRAPDQFAGKGVGDFANGLSL